MGNHIFKIEVAGMTKEVTLQVQYSRLLFYGGAKKSSDNSAFHFASLNVMEDYGYDGNIERIAVDSAKKIVDKINSQQESSIQSVDFFFHGDMFGLYMVKGASIYKDILDKDVEDKNLNTSLYLGSTSRFLRGNDVHEDSRVISDIDFSKFTNSCKIEVHGCLTAHDMYIKDNICEELSELLYKNDKKRSVVIGHTQKANPNIKDKKYIDEKTGKTIEIKTKNKEQDYRHGERKIFHNGNIILTTNKKGRIAAKEINNALPKE